MSASHEAVPLAAGHVIENPLSGEQITIRGVRGPVAACSSGNWCSPPAGGCRAATLILEQEECFTVLAGRMRFRVGGRRVIAGPGDTVRVPPGTVHHFANAGSRLARVAVQTRPALSMRELLETAAAHGHGTARGRPPGAQPDRPGAVHARFRAGGAGALSPGRAGPRRHPPARLAGQAARADARYRRLRYPDAGRAASCPP